MSKRERDIKNVETREAETREAKTSVTSPVLYDLMVYAPSKMTFDSCVD